MKILILGAGPTGLGAAWKLHQLGHADWELWEADSQPGGLSRSVTDEHGFTWDIGGHVLFSHYQTFDRVINAAVGEGGWIEHERESWIRLMESWVPYPFQNNIHRLPREAALRCLNGLIQARCEQPTRPTRFENFEQLVRGTFGEGVAELFMVPYNQKVWAYPLSELATSWIGERVALPDLTRITESMITGRDNVSWGPNNTFRFPKRGGTGAIWRAVAATLPQEKIHFDRRAVEIDVHGKTVVAEDGTTASYDALITTLPLDELVETAGLQELRGQAGRLRYSSTHLVGVALRGRPSETLKSKCWMYFPEGNCPFYRVTVFSNYSPNNVPDPSCWSLMAEVSESPAKPVDSAQVIDETIDGMVATGLIEERDQIHHGWQHFVRHSYPTPSLERDEALRCLLPALEKMGIYSRGRFGAWRYEVANQDHSFMQGVEVAARVKQGTPELTLWFPELVNNPHPAYGKNWL